MKKIIFGMMAATLIGTGAQTASAHDGWSTTGKVLTGLLGARVVASVIAPPVVVYQAPVVYPAPTVIAAPVVVQSAPVPAPAVACAPPTVVVAPAPVYVAPAPIFGFYYGPGYYHRYHGRR